MVNLDNLKREKRMIDLRSQIDLITKPQPREIHAFKKERVFLCSQGIASQALGWGCLFKGVSIGQASLA